MKVRYLVILEEGETSVRAYVPDLPGCVAVGETRDEATKLIREAIELHVESPRETESLTSPSFVCRDRRRVAPLREDVVIRAFF
ncbi:MAG TPA: type II toxin-antitoxin system HicB family antitoxin [Thermoanaerobaculia bacterium]|nr:type II toxin-antitoxin system HicB family antitoxin [Thermoanaerobaculia bacterium]